MKIALALLLALLAFSLIIHGLRLLWRTAQGAPQGGHDDGALEGEKVPAEQPWVSTPMARWTILLMVILFVMIALLRILETDQGRESGRYEPPRLENGQIIPGQFHPDMTKQK